MHRRRVLLSLATVLASGCATWNQTPPTDVSLQPLIDDQQRGQSTSHLTITFLAVGGDADRQRSIADLWQSADVGPIDADARRQWRANGCQIGVISDRSIIDQLHRTAPQPTDPHDLLSATADVRDDSSGTQETLALPIGKPHFVTPGKPAAGETVAMCNLDGKVVAKTLDGPQSMLVTQLVSADARGGLRINVQPTIQHGQNQRRFVSSEAAIRIHSDRPQWTLQPLGFDWDASDGETLLMGSTDLANPRGLASQFFAPAGQTILVALTAQSR